MTWKDIKPLRPRSSIESERITNIPTRDMPSVNDINEIQKYNISKASYDNGFRLLPSQVDALYSWNKYKRGFFSIAVGEGKTLTSILIASNYFEENPEARIIVFMPASVYRQLWVRDIPWAKRNCNVLVPFIGLGQRTQKQRMLFAKVRRPGCYLFPYSLLSTLDTIDLLNNIDADLVIADEAHYLKGSVSAKTKRFWHWLENRDPAPILVSMSGTLSSKTPLDYYRIIKHSLREYNPLPNLRWLAEEWSAVLDSEATRPTNKQARLVRPLTEWAGTSNARVKEIREAYRMRLQTCPGFMSSPEEKIGTSILIQNLEARADGDDFNNLCLQIKKVEDDWEAPSGDFLTYGLEKHKILTELATGFYYRLYWPEHPLTPAARNCWEAKQDFNKQLRGWYSTWRKPRRGLDTPMAVCLDMERNGRQNVPKEVYRLWKEWKAQERPNLPERLSEPVRICDFKIQKAVNWTYDKPGGILWYYHTAVGDWLEEYLREAGRKCIRKKAGDTWLHNDGSEEFFVVASIKAHGIGKNLQHHSNQLLVQLPRSGTEMEQLLGRVHRKGQKADSIVVNTLNTVQFDHENLSVILKQTIYAQETLGGQKKLLIADWSPLPRDYSDEILKRKGWKLK